MGKRPGYRHRHIDFFVTKGVTSGFGWQCNHCGTFKQWGFPAWVKTRDYVRAEKEFVKAHRYCKPRDIGQEVLDGVRELKERG